MYKNYILTAWRNIVQQQIYSVINIGGLALGLAACILILLFVRDELSYDQWIKDGDRIAKLELHIPIPGRDSIDMGQVPPAYALRLKEFFPNEIEATTRVLQRQTIVGHGDNNFNETVSFVDPNFLNFFSFEMVSGNRDTLITSNSDILISEKMAEKYFGNKPPLDETLNLVVQNEEVDFRVAGVFKDIPLNSHMPFQFFAQLDPIRFAPVNEGLGGAWLQGAYVKFFEGVDPMVVENQLVEYYMEIAPPRGNDESTYDYRKERKFNFINVRDIYLFSDKIQQLKPISDISSIISFSIAAIFILIIASINFMNLSTARAIRRSKEVSMRKVLGASRSQLVKQFLGEAILTSLISLGLALILVEIILPFFSQYLVKNLVLDLLNDPLQSLIILSMTIAVGASGGIYPAVFLSNYKPAHVLGASTSSNKGSVGLRKALVVFQFAISIILIVSTAIVYQQNQLLRDMDIGINKDNKLVLTGLSGEKVSPNEPTLREAFLKIPGVTAAALSSDELPLIYYNDFGVEIPAHENVEMIDTDRFFTDTNFFEVYNIKTIAGRPFSEAYGADALVIPEDKTMPWSRSGIVTTSFVTRAEFTPEDIIGELVIVPQYGTEDQDLHVTIVGVINDLHLRALHERTGQMMFLLSDQALDVMTLNVVSNDLPATLSEIDAVWKNLVPEVPINHYFVDDKFNDLYRSEFRRGELFGVFSAFAILVSCLGLFGLSAFAAEQRTREIGIRKVLGAKVSQILNLVTWQFVRSVIWANLIAWPIAYYTLSDWLTGFEFRVDLSPAIFIYSGLGALALAWITVAWQAYKVARKNPIHALRYE